MADWQMAPFLQIDPLSPYGKNKTLRKLPPISPGAQDTPQTKLDLLKCQYQQKLEREKQVKLMAIYKQQYQEALYRLRTSYLLETHSGPYRMSATYEHSSAETTRSQSPLAEDQDSGWTQIAFNPQGKRSSGVDRSHPLRPIDRKCSGLSNILNAEGDSSDWRSLIPLDAPMWPAVTFRPSPPKGPKGPKGKCQSSRSYLRSRETGVELEPLEDSTSPVEQRQRSSQCNKSTCAKGQQPREAQNNQQSGRLNVEVEISEKESLIQGRLRKIKEEIRQIQIQRDRAEEEEQGTENMVETVRAAREGVERERSERERPGRERPERERERSGKERSERERSGKERSERERSGRERSGRERSERERSGRERSGRERSERESKWSQREKGRSGREKPGRKRAEQEREKERAERQRAKSDRTERERAEREKAEKASLLEVEREMKQRQRGKIHRENLRNVDGQKAAQGSREKAGKIKRSRHNNDEELTEDSSFDQCSSEEYTDHSNPFADYKEDTSEAKNNDTDEDTDRSRYSNSPQNERTEWDGHYSPEEKAHCSFCGRRFVLDRLNTHIEICKKVYKRKRKVYDSAQKRAKGTDLENYQCSHKITPAPKGNWKLKHDSFIRMLHAAQQIELEIYRGKKKGSRAAPSPSLNSDYIQCPHCSRRFEPNVAHSHIPKCKTLRSRPAPPKR